MTPFEQIEQTPFENVQIASPTFKADPYPFYTRLRTEAPVCRVRLPDKQEAWLVARYDDVLALLKDRRFAKNRRNATTPEQLTKQPWIPPVFAPLMRNMLDLDDPEHGRLRGLVHKAFTPQRIGQMAQRIQILSDTLLDKAEAQGSLDLIRDFALPLPVTVIADLLGVPENDHQKFARWSNTLIKNTGSRRDVVFSLPDMLAFVRFIRHLVRLRRAEPQDDLVSALAQAEAAGDYLSEDELLAMVAHLTFGQGVHYCVGAALARMEGQIALNTLLRRFPALRLAQAPEHLRWRRGLVLRGLKSLPLVFTPQGRNNPL